LEGDMGLRALRATFPPPSYGTPQSLEWPAANGRTRGGRGRLAVPGELDAHLEPIRVSASCRWAPAHPRVLDGRGLDRGGPAPARADDHAGAGCPALPGDDCAGDPEHDGADRTDRPADRHH